MKRIFSVALILVICVAFFSCAKGNDTDSTTTSIQNSTTTTTEITTIQATTTSAMTEQDALAIAKNLIGRLNAYNMYGTSCGFEYVEGDELTDAINSITPLLTAEQKDMMGVAYLQKCTCCTTFDQAINHTYTFLDSSLLGDSYWESCYVECDGNLYFMMLPTGINYYDQITIKSFDNDTIIAQADLFGDFYEPVPPCEFTIEKVGEIYKITAIESL